MNILDIGEVVRLSGIPASTLRYYEEKGLINSVGRHGLRRQFDPSVLTQLSFISLGRLAGLSLDEINTMFQPHGKIIVDREKLQQKSDEIDQRIKQLTAMRDGLRHAAVCPEENHFSCQKFNKLLRISTKRVKQLKS
ncbi:helix-turn-helix domain-containing protein [Thalassotalea sp. 1_MG-2023]|uniref:helix-turn-helix domain-containing protein n=1 Tax=Thalassotalea sp. 1_MG-2023 TaxID=3062680 RepID=UPI0026E1EDEC|nr:helix-turn-helix domain-containing protein [Thalassotalea sp. 1_MG-2023]MDO6428754.1 helix-turn-helix domain-containing protein [Thalassotalea sp. 1_MG-2023]